MPPAPKQKVVLEPGDETDAAIAARLLHARSPAELTARVAALDEEEVQFSHIAHMSGTDE